MKPNFKSLVELLRFRSEESPNEILYTFLADSGQENQTITYSQLDERARAIAAYLLEQIKAGDRALLLFQPGIDYIEAFMGCLYAGIVPVPAYPPDGRNLKRLMDVIQNAKAEIALSTSTVLNNVTALTAKGGTDTIRQEAATFANTIKWVLSDEIKTQEATNWKENLMTGETLAFLQYTSGSTSNPKGVILNHENLLYNFEFSKHAFGMNEDKQMISWLPPYHDMGLIGGILQPMYVGMQTTLMSPISFLKRPLRWLQTISECGNNGEIISGAPNFAYELCSDRIQDRDLEGLDLSNWKVAFNGAEPIRSNTMDRFTNKFTDTGFKKEFFFPVYGLAEATLLVTAGDYKQLPVISDLDKEQLEKHTAIPSSGNPENEIKKVGCGQELDGQKVRVVDPETNLTCNENNIGEVWIAGPNVSQGYWNNEEETAKSFGALTADTNEGPFFRTGDMGFYSNGELYITGRLKEMIIIRGRNYYPQDIELTVQQSDPSLRMGCGAAFSIDRNDEEQLIIVQEVRRDFKRKIDPEVVKRNIAMAVSKEHQLQASDIVLIEPSSFPKTSSGKLQRRASREMYKQGELKTLDIPKIAQVQP
ncbi:fatty acyl-AMP ligase [Aquimarina sp. 2201CG5-10]|uniref:fatty acyl-AMP ligase n=1 Tax=Aquimarina callyspongiae TaxID=3098150 RepID=UPI002AB41E01|nr:fatty acyl-AMP ligase [Aquimarina sp. 2201CG5-10]MDY8138357.1 fatty acyl-AMP ligase [Aquimarina sp. 2201CG5-10]